MRTLAKLFTGLPVNKYKLCHKLYVFFLSQDATMRTLATTAADFQVSIDLAFLAQVNSRTTTV